MSTRGEEGDPRFGHGRHRPPQAAAANALSWDRRPTDATCIFMADDHMVARKAIHELLAEAAAGDAGESGTSEPAAAVAAPTSPDAARPGADTPRNRQVRPIPMPLRGPPHSDIIVLVTRDDLKLIEETLDLDETLDGSGLPHKHKIVCCQDLVRAICATRDEGHWMVISASGRPAVGEEPANGRLSHRECEVLMLVASALSNRQIAASLSITEGTVKGHLRNIFGKLGAVSRIDAVNKAVAASLISGSAATGQRSGSPRPLAEARARQNSR
jgi:two-component system, NarL family, nitrate/nitrite response regulator NarL